MASSLTSPNGVSFIAVPGTSEFVKRWDPRPGQIVSFKHRGFLAGSGKPKQPAIYRVREDIGWDEVVRNFNEPTASTRPASGITTLIPFSPPYLTSSISQSCHFGEKRVKT